MEYDEDYEIYKFIKEAADNYVPTKKRLKAIGLTFDEAYQKAWDYKNEFYSLLKSHGIDSEIPEIILIDICKQTDFYKDAGIFRLYSMAVNDRILLFENITDKEQMILCWLDIKDKVDELMAYLQSLPVYRNRLENLVKSIKKSPTEKADLEEQANLYKMSLEHGFIYKYGYKNNLYLNNVGELVRLVNSNEQLKSVKPYVYSAVISRKHKMLLERADYTPNLKDVFKYKEYKIYDDNGKNFDTYQSYLELYEQLQRHYSDDQEVDIGFSDYCFANLSNLSEWYHENCQPNEPIPMQMKRTILKYYGFKSWFFNDIPYFGDFVEENPVMEIAFDNTLDNHFDLFREFVNAVYNEEDTQKYVEEFYRLAEAEKLSPDRKKGLLFAKLYLTSAMEDRIKYMMVDSAEDLIK